MTQFRVSNAHGLEMLGVRTLAGVTTATLAILAAQPTDVVKIRMQAGARTGQYRLTMFLSPFTSHLPAKHLYI